MPKKKVLFVDDDTDIHDIVSVILEDEDIDLVNAVNVFSVADIANAEPDLILLDEWLPNKKGSDFCLELKAKMATAHIPVILISAAGGLETIAMKCRADGFIRKPFNIDRLKQVVLDCLMTSTR